MRSRLSAVRFVLAAIALGLVVWLAAGWFGSTTRVAYFVTCHCPSCERMAIWISKRSARTNTEIRVVDTLKEEGQSAHLRLLDQARLDFARFGECPAVFRFASARDVAKGEPFVMLGEEQIKTFFSSR